MSEPKEKPEQIKAMKPAGKDGRVTISDPPKRDLEMSADHAEISGIRLMDAAMKARGQ